MARETVAERKGREDALIAVIRRGESLGASLREQEAGIAAWAQLFHELHPLIYRLSHRYLSGGNKDQQLIGVAKRGLKKALSHYKPERQYKFSTYATWWIRAEIHRYLGLPLPTSR